MPTLVEGRLRFLFPDGWEAARLDRWSFYVNQFQGLGQTIRLPCDHCGAELRCKQCKSRKIVGMKCMDFLAVGGHDCWLIEVKDYRMNPRTKVIDLGDEMALKLRDSLALLAAASRNANDETERALASAAIRAANIRVVLHLEQPARHSKLFPRAIDPADVLQRLKQLLKSVDPRVQVTEMAQMRSMKWSVKGLEV